MLQCVMIEASWPKLFRRHAFNRFGILPSTFTGPSPWQRVGVCRVYRFHSLLVPPLVFSGLIVTLWVYKCVMMVVFQDKIIYMPSIPPFSRSEKISDFHTVCRPIDWSELYIKAADGTKLALVVGDRPDRCVLHAVAAVPARRRKHIIVIYFQGYTIQMGEYQA